jgi:hypothetical protein
MRLPCDHFFSALTIYFTRENLDRSCCFAILKPGLRTPTPADSIPDARRAFGSWDFLTDHTSPLAERWGGWYVTGQHGETRHMGNVLAHKDGHEIRLDREAGANVTRLDERIPMGRYPRADSDLVALMVLEHQVTMHNLLAEGALRVCRWLHYQTALHQELGEPVTAEPTGTALRVIETETLRILTPALTPGWLRRHSRPNLIDA